MAADKSISSKQLSRLPIYLKLLYSLKDKGIEKTSAPQIAKALQQNEEQVRKDLQVVSSHIGKPKSGRVVVDLIDDIETFLGYHDATSTIIVGVGHLGGAFMNYSGFSEFGLNILAGFDVDENLVGGKINNKEIFHVDSLEEYIVNHQVHLAILVTPTDVAQNIANRLVKSGIKAIWNFVPIQLRVPEDVIVENVNLASSLAVLSHKLKLNLEKEEKL